MEKKNRMIFLAITKILKWRFCIFICDWRMPSDVSVNLWLKELKES
ncbi:hypothetical protein [Galactobacillus timonensis]|nr:hypothetical protein [Galactobacillus timonensis]